MPGAYPWSKGNFSLDNVIPFAKPEREWIQRKELEFNLVIICKHKMTNEITTNTLMYKCWYQLTNDVDNSVAYFFSRSLVSAYLLPFWYHMFLYKQIYMSPSCWMWTKKKERHMTKMFATNVVWLQYLTSFPYAFITAYAIIIRTSHKIVELHILTLQWRILYWSLL